MKKIISLLLVCLLAVSLCACSQEQKTDWEYIKDKGIITIGMTIYEPMNYYDEDGELIGFDTELALALGEKLGVDVEFVVIDWNNKVAELNGFNIDLIWNGMTIREELDEEIDFSIPYSGNAQVCVINQKNADKYTDLASMKGAVMGAEAGSAGADVIKATEEFAGNEVIDVKDQRASLLELKSGTIDVAVIDSVMAGASVGEGTDYADLMVVEGINLTSEEYGIGIRENSPVFLEKVNSTLLELAKDGTVAALMEKYPTVQVLLPLQ